MDAREQWLAWMVELQSIAQAGLFYGRDQYDRERYQRLRELAAEMVAFQSQLPMETVRDLFCNESGYQTPKLDSRAAIFREDAILLVQENDGKWSLPGGWVDVDRSIRENVIKEVKEEAGLDVTADLVIAVQDKDKRNPPASAQKICKVFVLCTAIGGQFQPNLETIASGYFPLDALPELSTDKTTAEQIRMCFDAYHTEHWTTLLD